MTKPQASAASRAFNRNGFVRNALFASVSAGALLATLVQVEARSLNGGSSGGVGAGGEVSAAAAAASAAQTNAQTAIAAAARAMVRANQSLEAMRAVQAAARAAAQTEASQVPNGLVGGGLVVAPGAGTTAGVWSGAGLPEQKTAGGRTEVKITQTEQKAILNWSSFNVGRETDVVFDQKAGGTDVANWIALNRVTDPNLAPSRILGTIKAEGQVYVVNRNGIVFGGSSQVNVHTFVASSLSLSDAQFRAGINQPLFVLGDSQDDFGIPTFGDSSGIAPNTNRRISDPLQTPALSIGAAPGDVIVLGGAQISTVSGGKAMLFAPHVINGGTIKAPDGQVILAAGENVWLSTSGSVRGLDVAVSAVTPYMINYAEVWEVLGWGSAYYRSYTSDVRETILPGMDRRAATVDYRAVNLGVVEAERGNITMRSRSVDQLGALYANTALNNRDGSILLQAWGQGMYAYSSNFDVGSQMVWWRTGNVTLGQGSVTLVVPDRSDTSTIEATSVNTRYRAGTVDLRGTLIDIQRDASVIVPSGTINVTASSYLPTVVGAIADSRDPTLDGSRIYIAENATLSVAGITDVSLAMDSNIVKADLRINELRDSVLYRGSWLSGTTVSVDRRENGSFVDGPMSGVQWLRDKNGNVLPGRWEGTPLADVSQWLGTGLITLAELSTKAGSISLKAGGDVITRPGSVISVAGGALSYRAGYIKTTKLLGADGRVYDISDATPDRLYVSLADGGFTRTHNVQGQLDTRLTENWRSVFDRAGSGRYEQGYSEGKDAGRIQIYHGGALVLEGDFAGDVIKGERQVANGSSAKAGELVFGAGGNSERTWIPSKVVITDKPLLLGADFNALSSLPGDFLSIAEESRNGVVTRSRTSTTYLGTENFGRSGLGSITIFYNKSFELVGDSTLELSPGAKLNLTANTSFTSSALVDGTIRIAGGNITLANSDVLTLTANAVLDVSGRWVNDIASGPQSDLPAISGGGVGISTSKANVSEGAVIDVSGGGWLKGRVGKTSLKLGDAGSVGLQGLTTADVNKLDLRAYAAGAGGGLRFTTTGSVQIGGIKPTDPAILYLSNSLFGEKGFRTIAVQTNGDVIIPAGALVAQRPVSIDLRDVNLIDIPTDAPMMRIGMVHALDDVERAKLAPASLSVSTSKQIFVNAGSVLRSDIGGSIALDSSALGAAGNESIQIKGAIDAPAGSISITAPNILLSSSASLTARGLPLIDVDFKTQTLVGEVRKGGTVALSGLMNLAKDAVIDVSGGHGVVTTGAGRNTQSIDLASDGGSISLATNTTSIVDATLIGRAGGPTAAGGVLSVQDSSTAVADRQNTFGTPTYIGYFVYVGTGGRYNYNPSTKVFSAAAGNTGAYNFTGNSYTALDLDPFNEFGTANVLMNATIRSAIMNLAKSALGPTQIVDGLAVDAAAGGSIRPSTTNAALTEQIAYLVDSYLFTATRSGPASAYVYTPAAKFNVKNLQSLALTVSSGAIANGGFSALNFTTPNGLKLGDGLKLDLSSARVTLATPQIVAPTDGARAELSAAYLSLQRAGQSLAAVPNTTPASGSLTLNASLIDASYFASRGFANTNLNAGEIRFNAPVGTQAQMSADGTLTLAAGQIYPTTQITGAITAVNKIVIAPNGTSAAPWSAAGTLTLAAPDIEINGTLRAPFGAITLTATNSIRMGASADVSVSGDGLLLPYGTIYDTDYWATILGSVVTTLSSLPEKKITLDAPRISMAAGSSISIAGGGDLYASEHVIGTGGSHNVLTRPGMYAIVPDTASASAAINTGTTTGSRVWLDGGSGVAAGWYTLLPANYALLPGAMAIQMVAGSTGNTPRSSLTLLDGSMLMSGRRGNVFDGSSDQLSSTWRLLPGSTIRRYSEFNERTANAYFASETFKLSQYRLTGVNVVTPRLPMDGGSLLFKATQQLTLDGGVQSQGAGDGRGGWVDISAGKIVLAGAGHDVSDLSGYLVLDTARLSALGAESLLIGGTRKGSNTGTGVTVAAESVILRNDAGSALTGPELILASSNSLIVDEGSVIAAEGNIAGGGGNLVMTPAGGTSDYGAVMRLSNGDAVNVTRTNIDAASPRGVVDIRAGAVVNGGKALLVEATRDTTLAGSATVAALDITLGASRINFGAGGAGGLTFDVATLSRFAASENLTLRSYSTIDFYAGVNFGAAGLRSVTLDAAGLVSRAAGQVAIEGNTLRLRNSVGTFVEPGVPNQASLVLSADNLVFGAGAKTLRGFSSVDLTGRTRIVSETGGSLDAGSASVIIRTPVITGRNGSAHSLTTTGALLAVGTDAQPLARDADSLGSRWDFVASNIVFAGRIDALGGSVNLNARNGALVLAPGARIDVGGYAKSFYDIVEYADAGSISLTAVGGGVDVQAGSMLDLSAVTGGGNAGTLTAVAATSGTVSLNGAIDARAPRGAGGKFTLDIAQLPDFAGFSRQLDAAGFTTSRSFRVRSGNVVVNGVTKVEDFGLATDAGVITVAGVVDAVKAYGGSITMVGGGGLVMDASSSLRATSTTALGGGRVLLDAGSGRLDIRGGNIDVSGGEGGKVRFRAMQVAGPDHVAVDRLVANIIGARSSVLEGVWRAPGSVSVVDAALIQDAVNASNAFASHASDIATRLGLTNVAVMPGVEIRSSGDLTVSQDWSLASMPAHEGGLTLRAAGNLNILANISDGFNQAGRSGALNDQRSWDLRLIAGADLNAADPMMLAPGAIGSVTVGDATNGYLVRTGTGDLSVSTGGDVTLANYMSAIYTAGRRDATGFNDFVQNPRYTWINGVYTLVANPEYGIDGGNVSVKAGRNVKALIPTDRQQLIADWLLRQGRVDADGNFVAVVDNMFPNYIGMPSHPAYNPILWQSAAQQSAWWVDYSKFQHGIGALGGGNIALSAGGDVTDITLALATNGQVRGGRSPGEAKTLVMRNGGLMTVDVAGAINGGQYHVGRGSATISAGSLGFGQTTRTVTRSTGTASSVNELLPLAPILALGDTDMQVKTAGNMTVQTVADALMLLMPFGSGGGSRYDYGANMTSYTERTSLSLMSIGGDVTLGGPWALSTVFPNGGQPAAGRYWLAQAGDAMNIYPAVTHIAALNGAFSNTGEMRTMPATHADLTIVAEKDVVTGDIIMARNNPAAMPSAFRPSGSTGSLFPLNQGISNLILGLGQYGGTQVIDNPNALLLANDYEPSRIYSTSGSVVGKIGVLPGTYTTTIKANEQLWIRAGGDIRDLTAELRNLHQVDVSWLDAGNDVSTTNLTVQGPGSILLTASRDIYAPRIYTSGNRRFDGSNRPVIGSEILGLPENGASIELIAGLKDKTPSYDAFIAAYLDPANVASMPLYLIASEDGRQLPIYLTDARDDARDGKLTRAGIVSFVKSIIGRELSPLEAWSVFQSMPELTQQRFVRQVYFQELRQSGRSKNDEAIPGGYERGFSAIATLFPGSEWKGDITSSSIYLRTMAGGDIVTMTPGGSLQVASLQKQVPAGDGLVTLGYGNINIFARDHAIVNRSRILTFAGGDETIWTTFGDIDAGRGAKTTRTPSAPEVVTNVDTVTEIKEKADMSGSGIGTVEGFTGVEPGDVDLIAPRGTVNAGDAGIRVSGNFNVAALFVLNIDNIKVSGESKGVPKQESVAVNLTVETKDKAAADAVKDASQASANERPSVIIVEVLGYGGGDSQDQQRREEEQRKRSGSRQQTYDTRSPFQVVGAGHLNELGQTELSAEEKKLLLQP